MTILTKPPDQDSQVITVKTKSAWWRGRTFSISAIFATVGFLLAVYQIYDSHAEANISKARFEESQRRSEALAKQLEEARLDLKRFNANLEASMIAWRNNVKSIAESKGLSGAEVRALTDKAENDFDRIYNDMFNSLFADRRYEEAEVLAKKWLVNIPTSVGAHLALAQVYIRLRRGLAARSILDDVKEIAPKDSRVIALAQQLENAGL